MYSPEAQVNADTLSKSVTVRLVRNPRAATRTAGAASGSNRCCRSLRPLIRSRVAMRQLIAFAVVFVATIIIYKLYASLSNSAPAVRARALPPELVAEHQRDPQQFTYAIVFDAGSTGTRLHVYRFLKTRQGDTGGLQEEHENVLRRINPHRRDSQTQQDVFSTKDAGGLRLVNELFKETKPGLSSFASNPKEASKSVEQLLVQAQSFVPCDAWQSTPIALYATAGLRLLAPNVAEAILNEVRQLFRIYPFRVCADCVRVLDGLDEGVYAWYAINYLLDLTDTLQQQSHELEDNQEQQEQQHKHTVGVIDFGGGSLQITFLPQSSSAVPSGFLHKLDQFGSRPLSVYSHSYLGLGLNAVRLQILSLTTPNVSSTEKADEQSKESSAMTDIGSKSTSSNSRPISSEESTEDATSAEDSEENKRIKEWRRLKKPTLLSGSKSASKNLRKKTRNRDTASETDTSVETEKTRSRRDVQIAPRENITYTSPCLMDDHVGSFRFQNMMIAVSGMQSSDSFVNSRDRFETCYALARSVVTAPLFAIHAPREAHFMLFYIQSYFYDRAVETGLINADVGGSVTLEDFERVAKTSCNDPTQAQSQPLLCLDLSVIVALLRDGFKFEEKTEMMVMKFIQNIELSWTLGAAFPLISANMVNR